MGILFVDGCGKGWKRAALGVGVRGYPLVEKRDEWGSLCGNEGASGPASNTARVWVRGFTLCFMQRNLLNRHREVYLLREAAGLSGHDYRVGSAFSSGAAASASAAYHQHAR